MLLANTFEKYHFVYVAHDEYLRYLCASTFCFKNHIHDEVIAFMR